MSAPSKRPALPGKLAGLPVYEFSTTLPTTRADQARKDIIFGVDSMDALLREVNDRLAPTPPTSSVATPALKR